jgi:hypothetical protein
MHTGPVRPASRIDWVNEAIALVCVSTVPRVEATPAVLTGRPPAQLGSRGPPPTAWRISDRLPRHGLTHHGVGPAGVATPSPMNAAN